MNTANMIADILNDANDRVKKVQARAKVMDQLAEVGIKPNYMEGVLRWGYTVDVDKSQLTAIRGVVGRLKMRGKDAAHDFETSNEIAVKLEPVDKSIPIVFEYRTKFRKGGKCEVVQTISPASINTSLVCKL